MHENERPLFTPSRMIPSLHNLTTFMERIRLRHDDPGPWLIAGIAMLLALCILLGLRSVIGWTLIGGVTVIFLTEYFYRRAVTKLRQLQRNSRNAPS